MLDFVSLAIVGALVSVLVQFIKRQTYVSPVLAVIVLSIIAGAGYVTFRDSNVWNDMLQVLVYANTVYLFFIKPVAS